MKEHFQFKEAKRMLFHPMKTGSWVNKVIIDVLAILVARQFLRYA